MLQTLRGPDRAVPEQTAWESPSSAAGLQEHQDPAQPQTVWLAGRWALETGERRTHLAAVPLCRGTELQVPALAQHRALPKHSAPHKRQRHVSHR